ncbi:MAG: hypothetical protein IPN49_17110 [Saprospiraceae bacterium]|nr:hypothetical protein [Saprospiraceae bacterium]
MEQNSTHNVNTRILQILQYFCTHLPDLYMGRTLFIPLSFAVLISFLLFPVSSWMENKGMPRVLAPLSSLVCWLLFFWGVWPICFLPNWPN